MSDNIFKKAINPTKRGRVIQVIILIAILSIVSFLIVGGNYYNRGAEWVSNKTNGFIPLPQVKNEPFNLGLDLQGGTHLVYQADTSMVPAGNEASAIEGVRDVIERRVNAFGITEPLVQVNGHRIIVELAGIKDSKEAIKMIGETPILEFKEQVFGRDLTIEEDIKIKEVNDRAKKKAEEFLGKILSRGNFAKLAPDYDEMKAFDEAGKWIDSDSNPEVGIAVSKLRINGNTDIIETPTSYSVAKLLEKRIAKNELTGEEKVQVLAKHILICYKDAQACESELSKEEAYAKIEELKKRANKNNFVELAKENSTEPGASETGGDLGWFGKGMMVKPFEDEVFSQKIGTISSIVETDFGYHLIYKENERKLSEYRVQQVSVAKMKKEDVTGSGENWVNTKLTGKNLERSAVQFDPQTGRPEVGLEFDKEGADLFEEITGRNVGKPIAIFLDGEIISAPNVNSKISGGQASISGNFNIVEAKTLSQRLNAGALPVPVSLLSQEVVGASLGKASINKSLQAGFWGVVLVVIFMIVFYRLPGLVSIVTLGVYIILLLAVFKVWGVIALILTVFLIAFLQLSGGGLIMALSVLVLFIVGCFSWPAMASIPVTITLPGIAGIILSIGMAVDANILIFERFKEELKAGKETGKALELGFNRAWLSIRDGQISTIITCLILIIFSTGMVKGFAITLLFGVIISLFSAITVTKSILQCLPEKWLEKQWLTGVKKISSKETVK